MLALTAGKKLEELKRRISEKENLLVAFSGGVDSCFPLTVAHEVPGEKVRAVTIDSKKVFFEDIKRYRSGSMESLFI